MMTHDMGEPDIAPGADGVAASAGVHTGPAHPAIVAREHGIPAVLAAAEATSRFEDGQIITVDGSAGTVTLHEG